MYVFKSSFLKAKKTNSGYQNVDISLMLMSNILEDYLDGYIVLTHLQLRGTFYLTIETLRATQLPLSLTQTFNQWLTHNHDKPLPTLNKMPIYTQGVVKYGDAFQSGFTINQIGRYLSVDANVPKSDKKDLLIKKGLPDKTALYKRMLVSVNGFLHRGYSHEGGIALMGAGTTFNNTGINTVGIFSFYDVCDIQQYKIDENMITPSSSTVPLYNELLIKLGVSLVDKSVILSLGGYLITSNLVIEIVNAEAGIIVIKTKKLDLVKMILKSVGIIEMDNLGVFQETKNITYNKVKPSEILSDVVVKKYLQLDQSFVIVADCETIHTETSDVGVTGIPGVYETKTEPMYPVLNSQGIIAEYFKTNQDDVWSIRLRNDVTKQFMYKTNIEFDNETINGMSPTYRWYHDDPKLIKIIGTHKPNI